MSGAIVVDYEELHRMSHVWAAAAESLVRQAMSVASITTEPGLLADAVFDPLGAARAEMNIADPDGAIAKGRRGVCVHAIRGCSSTTLPMGQQCKGHMTARLRPRENLTCTDGVVLRTICSEKSATFRIVLYGVNTTPAAKPRCQTRSTA